MKEFGDIGAFVTHLAAVEVGLISHLHDGLEKAAQAVEKTAKEEIGQYQQAVGPFPAWAPLAEATVDDRVRRGFTPDDPGLRRGDMRDSIKHETAGLVAAIGSDDQNLVFFELGTPRQPPRPVLGPAVERNHDKIEHLIGNATVRGLMGGQALPPSLEYDHEIGG